MTTITDLIFRPCEHLHRRFLLLACMISGLFLSACASQAVDPENVISARAQNRWDALLAGDFETAYAFYSPGYRSTMSMIDFAVRIRTQPVRWTSADYQDHSCTETTCTVRFKIGYMVSKPVVGLDKWEDSSILKEKWIKTDGQWWYLPD